MCIIGVVGVIVYVSYLEARCCSLHPGASLFLIFMIAFLFVASSSVDDQLSHQLAKVIGWSSGRLATSCCFLSILLFSSSSSSTFGKKQ